MRAFEARHGREGQLEFVYTCPDLTQWDIFSAPGAPGEWPTLDAENARRADEHEVSIKNSRGDLFTVINVPELTLSLEPMAADDGAGAAATSTTIEEQAITMTRSLGDLFAHYRGVSSEPELRTLSVADIGQRAPTAPLLVIASDGLWDLWTFEEVGATLERGGVDAVDTDGQLTARAALLCERTRAKGEDYFGEDADNLTAVIVDLQAMLL